jgi:hypothetical protein
VPAIPTCDPVCDAPVPSFRAALAALAIAVALVVAAGAQSSVVPDPFAFFQPLVSVSQADRHRIDRGDAFARILPARDGEVAVFAATRLNAEPERLVRWTRAIEAFKKASFVLAIGRFSTPPVLSDLDRLELDDVDLESIRKCRRGDCGIKLTASDIQSLRVVAASAGAEWKTAVQQEFRRLVLNRVLQYLSDGMGGLPPYVDHGDPVSPRDVFAGILQRSQHLQMHLPQVAEGLARFPRVESPFAESFLYWSKEHYGSGKPVISVTQVHIARPEGPGLPSVVVFGQELFATHYRDGSLGSSFVLSGEGQASYLVYVNRSRLDTLGGLLGGLKRALLEGRLSGEIKTAITTAEKRLESGDPP